MNRHSNKLRNLSFVTNAHDANHSFNDDLFPVHRVTKQNQIPSVESGTWENADQNVVPDQQRSLKPARIGAADLTPAAAQSRASTPFSVPARLSTHPGKKNSGPNPTLARNPDLRHRAARSVDGIGVGKRQPAHTFHSLRGRCGPADVPMLIRRIRADN